MNPVPHQPWYRELTRYHWFVLTVAALGWLFDTMDQQLFNLARKPAMTELLANDQQDLNQRIDFYSGLATSIFLIGWASGGLAFGILGDRIGRARVMMLTILVYSLCTGLSALSIGFWDFAFYRFLTGLGVGGEFAVGVALVAEVMPDRARPHALGLLQALSAVGNISAALINMGLGVAETGGLLRVFAVGETPVAAWRLMFVIGTIPALLALLIRRKLEEPQRWKEMVASVEHPSQLGSYAELFGNPRWRKNALVGLLLAFAGVVGLWGIGFFSFDLLGKVLDRQFAAEGLQGGELNGRVRVWVGVGSILQNLGGALGIYAYAKLTPSWGRLRPFALFFLLAMVSTAFVFWNLDDHTDVFWMLPVMGFCQLALFGGYAIYFPELFPTRLRSTGTSFCYNVGRFVAAIGPFTLGLLSSDVFGHYAQSSGDNTMPLRLAGVCMCVVFLLGLAALPFAPETRGQPLPE